MVTDPVIQVDWGSVHSSQYQFHWWFFPATTENMNSLVPPDNASRCCELFVDLRWFFWLWLNFHEYRQSATCTRWSSNLLIRCHYYSYHYSEQASPLSVNRINPLSAKLRRSDEAWNGLPPIFQVMPSSIQRANQKIHFLNITVQTVQNLFFSGNRKQ